jgi:hypothetical protein
MAGIRDRDQLAAPAVLTAAADAHGGPARSLKIDPRAARDLAGR